MRAAVLVVAVSVVAVLTAIRGEAHKPITSKYTFNQDVLPIVREKCGRCHVDGGVAPMSLMTAADATPWAESIRTELIAGRMPPWPIDTAPGHFANDGRLTGRELNVLLTWATGGTPAGDPVPRASPAAVSATWPLGKPDLELTLDAVMMPGNQAELVKSFVISTGTTQRRMVRAVDLLPGTPAIVRSARIAVRAEDTRTGDRGEPLAQRLARGETVIERTLALWEPGEAPVPLPTRVGFELPAGAPLDVQVRYKKTWQYEGKAMEDRSRVGIYFADDTADALRAIRLEPEITRPVPGGVISGVVGGLPRPGALRILGVFPDPDMTRVRATAQIVNRVSHATETIFTMRADPAWPRRYWFTSPVTVAAGATWSERFDPYTDPASLTRDAAASPDTPSPRALTLDVVPE